MENNRQRIPETRREITEGAIREFKLEDEGWKGEKQLVGGASFTSMFGTDKFMQIGWLRFVEEIMSNR